MRYLITRPQAEAEPLAHAVRALGHEAAIDSMLSITHFDDVELELDGVQAIMITSANGIRAYADVSPNRRIPIYAVGEASAAVARELGFRRVHAAPGGLGGDAGALAAFVAGALKPADGILMHISGTVVARELKSLLMQHGFNVFRVRLYESEPAVKLNDATKDAIRMGQLDGALFYSPRTAQIFTDLVIDGRLTGDCRKMRAFCLSEAVAEAAEKLPWRAIRVAAEPSQSAILALLAQDALSGKS